MIEPLIATVTHPPTAIDLTAVLVGGLSGAFYAVKRRFDITGVFTIAIVSGLGGGIIRDVLLQNGPPVALTNYWYLPLVFGAALVGFFFASLISRARYVLLVLDPLWMGLYGVVGAQKALNLELSAFAAVLVGCLSAFGGGVLRDLLAGEKPELVRPGPLNYLAAVFGTVAYVALVAGPSVDKGRAEIVAIATVFVLRMLAVKFGWRTSEPVDLPRAVPAVARRKGLLPDARQGSKRARRQRRRGAGRGDTER